MRHLLKKLVLSVAVALTVTTTWLPVPARAQTYQIDCAILLCLSGGWPTSAPCARARAEFVRRITPSPVEPPLQIWRCPMGASYETAPAPNSSNRIFEAFFQNNITAPRQSFPPHNAADRIGATWRTAEAPDYLVFPPDPALRFVQDRADIDISGPEFNFVRSIRVFDVRYARQFDSERDDECKRSANVVLGTYGTQGDFVWQRTSISDLPPAYSGLENWGRHCPTINRRSVFVEWRDGQGGYGFEQISY